MKLKADLRVLIQDQPKTILTASLAVGGATLTVASNGGFANNDYLILGKIGEEKTEVVKIGAAVSAGTSITIGACLYAHEIDTPVTKIDYNQVRFYRGSTNVATDSTALAAAQDIDPTELYSYYEDATYTTGYGFIRYYNSTSVNFSVFSDAISYTEKTGYTPRMLRSMRNKVRRLINEKDELNSNISNDEINEELNMTQDEIAHDRMWSFYEKIKSFSSVENQYEYNLDSTCFCVFDAMFDTQPLSVTDRHRMNILRWKTDVTGDPTTICMWGRKANVYPYPNSSADTTTLGAAITSTTATTITVADSSDFQTQGRVIIDDEVISYTGKTATTLTGCIRGEEGTTAATHLISATVTERDFIYHFQEEPEDLEDETDETAIPEPSAVVYKAAAECALNLEKQVLHDRLLAKADKALVQLRKVDEPKIKRIFGQVRDVSEIVGENNIVRDQNQYPLA